MQTDTLLIRHDRTIRNSLIQVDRERAQFKLQAAAMISTIRAFNIETMCSPCLVRQPGRGRGPAIHALHG